MTEVAERPDQSGLVGMTTDIVAAYVSNHVVQLSDMPNLIKSVFDSLANTTTHISEPAAAETEKKKPAVQIKKSVTDERLTCLHCGLGFKSLKRHLATHHDQTPDEYRAEWVLPSDYPMVAPAYAAKRSTLAKASGLGHSRRNAKEGGASKRQAKQAA